jgi:hypothetical protein
VVLGRRRKRGYILLLLLVLEHLSGVEMAWRDVEIRVVRWNEIRQNLEKYGNCWRRSVCIYGVVERKWIHDWTHGKKLESV